MTGRTEKKSETLEVRIPFPTKTAFMEKARAEGRAASEIVREQIDLYLRDVPEPVAPSFRQRAAALVTGNLKGVGLLLAGAASALAISLAASPATALPDARSAFMALDVNGDGVVSLAEFAAPRSDAFARLDRNADGRLTPDEF